MIPQFPRATRPADAQSLTLRSARDPKGLRLCALGWILSWGRWIRTTEWRDQNPLPYHLAMPQFTLPS